ncbi:hypothetical protein EMQ25_08880 [Arsenicitalea aurantiaca]|uniref:Uncharacterized protein n=1 Tax=Arsenicitalea aurantiaca TaxID=1783274 RepID=A0A433XAA3_9HYPH|nr:hypothetical protein [Arsenicitalea aurantiaca]RUT30984.1 hypothetical protein EMQ25_08880 [Arsenicitalea aurantiaca]
MNKSPATPEIAHRSAAAGLALLERPVARPFFGLIDTVILPDGDAGFAGAIPLGIAEACWIWMVRDLGGDLIDPAISGVEPGAVDALDALMPELLARAHEALDAATPESEAERRLRVQLGSDAAFSQLRLVLGALKSRHLLVRARAFGKGLDAIADEAGLQAALARVPREDTPMTALLWTAAIGAVEHPGRIVATISRMTGSTTELGFEREGFAPLIEALMAHAQAQLPKIAPPGHVDIEATRRALERFHRLVRALRTPLELLRVGRRAALLARMVARVSERIEPRLRRVQPDMTAALRIGRDGRLDERQLFDALNGVALLATVRECRDSLALNVLLEQCWTQAGQSLELHVDRLLEGLRRAPDDDAISTRLEFGIRMAEFRLGPDYAGVIRRAMSAALRRLGPAA